jgi:hypothetical protein
MYEPTFAEAAYWRTKGIQDGRRGEMNDPLWAPLWARDAYRAGYLSSCSTLNTGTDV